MKSFIAITLTILGLDYFFHTFGIQGLTAYLIIGLCYTCFVKVVKPLVRFFSLPVNIFTLGLFSFVINTLLTQLLFGYFGIHFSFINALVVSLEISIVASVVEAVIGD